MPATLTLPTIHTNGTGPDSLIEGYLDASSAVLRAIDAVQKVEFNARDYYPQGPEAYRKARDEHDSRLRRLAEVRAELLQIAEHVEDTRPKRS